MGAVHVKTVNDRLLNVAYSDPEIIKMLIKNWGMMESLAKDGDNVAPCVLVDLERAIGINISSMEMNKKAGFDASAARLGALTEPQFISIVYVLGLGYRQEEIAYVLGCTKQVVSKHISRGIDRIIEFLGEVPEVQPQVKTGRDKRHGKNKKTGGRSRGSVVKGARSLLSGHEKRKNRKNRKAVPHTRSGGSKGKKRDTPE